MSYIIPTVIEKRGRGDVAYDIFSRLLEDRIVFIGSKLTVDVANLIVAQLLFLDKESANDDVRLYINCYGGEVTAAMSIIDTMEHIRPDVSTIAVGVAASAAAWILACGAKGKRMALPNAEILLHQPLGGVEGQAKEIEIAAEHILKTKDRLYSIIAKQTGKSKSQIEKDADRDNWMTAKDAKAYGLVDKIVS